MLATYSIRYYYPNTCFNIDPKTTRVAPVVGALAAKLGVLDRICFTSFSANRTEAAVSETGGYSKACSGMSTAGYLALIGGGRLHLPTMHERLQNAPQACLQIPYDLRQMTGIVPLVVTNTMVDFAHESGKRVHVWTVNSEVAMHDMYAARVDGIMTDKIALLRRVSEQYTTAY